MNKYKELFDKALKSFGCMQVEEETIRLMELLDKEKIKNFLEIGIADGMSFYLWSSLCDPTGLKIGIDAPNGPWGKRKVRKYMEMASIKQRLISYAPNVHVFFGNSHDIYVQNWVTETLGDNELDFLFIDGDHAYEGAKKDYLFYSKFVRKDGIIALHDIKKTEKHTEVGCTVNKLWDEIEGPKTEFLSDSSVWGGIGVIRKSKGNEL
jgi:methyltransferase family protein